MRKFKTAKVDANVEAWCERVEPTELFISVVTVAELDQGVIRMERRDAPQGALLRAWLEMSVLEIYRDRILPVTLPVARACAAMNVPDKMELGDALIAATSRVHRLCLVTRNVTDFQKTGLQVINPWLATP